ncbi:MAG: tRNA A37 threonylcarbamoyladenosine dehydratase [Cellvibrionaceae bacterium]|jgi:tRNA A37 threonylcarbamoyladenosine dehydratase
MGDDSARLRLLFANNPLSKMCGSGIVLFRSAVYNSFYNVLWQENGEHYISWPLSKNCTYELNLSLILLINTQLMNNTIDAINTTIKSTIDPKCEIELQRFGGIIRLYGSTAFTKIQNSHALIIGIGGVGSWTAESLVRSGIGTITLMDMDDICITNTNRQIHTRSDTVGQSKIAVMSERLKAINPNLTLNIIDNFIDKENVKQYIDASLSIVIDAIDNAIDKSELIGYCKKNQIDIITTGSSGGKKDPSKITYSDLYQTPGDQLFIKMRNNLRRRHGFSRDTNILFGIEAIYSTEKMTYPDNRGETCSTKQFIENGEKLDCSGGYGASTMVTASVGLLAASRAIEHIIKNDLTIK